MGYYLLLQIKNYLMFCFSETLANKYKARVCEKEKVEIVGEEVRWNDPTVPKPFIIDMVKIKLTDLDLGSIDEVCLVDESIYFMGHRGKESSLYCVHTYFFFNSSIKLNLLNESAMASPVPLRDQPPPNSHVIVSHPRSMSSLQSPDFLYLSANSRQLSLKSQQVIYEIANY